MLLDGQVVKDLRTEKGLSRDTVEKRTRKKVTKTRLGKIERGEVEATDSETEALAKLFAVEPEVMVLPTKVDDFIELETIGHIYVCKGKAVTTMGVFSGWVGKSKEELIEALTDLVREGTLAAGEDFFHMQAIQARGFLMQHDADEVGAEVFDEEVGLYVMTDVAINTVLRWLTVKEEEDQASVPRAEFNTLLAETKALRRIIDHISEQNPDLFAKNFDKDAVDPEPVIEATEITQAQDSSDSGFAMPS